LLSKGFSDFSNSTCKSINSSVTQTSLWSKFQIHTWLLEKPYIWLDEHLLAKKCLCFCLCCWRRLRIPWTAMRFNQSILKEIVLNINWNNWCWSWNSNTLATRCKELTPLKRPWCWERLKMGGERDGRGWDSWVKSLIQWSWVWVIPGFDMDREAWCAAAWVSKSQTWLSDRTELNCWFIY